VSEQAPVIDISGFLKSIHIGSLTIPVYFLITSLAFVVCVFWLVRRADRRLVSRNRALDIALVIMIAGFIFARLFHVFFEEPAYYWESPMRVFDIWRGGFVWYGGAIGATLATIGFLRWKREPMGRWLDLFAPICAAGHAMGRVACLFVGCCYGKTFTWGDHVIRHPTQAYSIILETMILAYLVRTEKSKTLPEGGLFLRWIFLHSFARMVIEQFRDDPRGPMYGNLSISTWISLAIFVGTGVTLLRSRLAK
jgi:phosphatidylglycerol:prolipoprotein diacylglycerol transferase